MRNFLPFTCIWIAILSSPSNDFGLVQSNDKVNLDTAIFKMRKKNNKDEIKITALFSKCVTHFMLYWISYSKYLFSMWPSVKYVNSKEANYLLLFDIKDLWQERGTQFLFCFKTEMLISRVKIK